ncbi:MAG TPA: hypothetical protein VK498_03215 [Ferruginibacter sp.]|nr:hypothetical protein [Ferruginibacter sp.]
MDNQYYFNHRNYENLISRSLRRPTTIRDVKRLSAYLKFVHIRDGFSSRNDKLEVQFELLKKYLFDAFKKFLKRRLRADEKAGINDLIDAVQSANYIEQIDIVIQKGLEITLRLK